MIGDSEEGLVSAIARTAERRRILVQMKSILALIKHRMNKQSPDQTETTLASLRLNCEQQISTLGHLLSLHLDKEREEENRFEKVLEYAELWSRDRGGHATSYEKKRAASISADFNLDGENAMTVAREAEMTIAVNTLKKLAAEFGSEGQDLETR